MLQGCNAPSSNDVALPEENKTLTQDCLRETLNHTLQELKTLSNDTPIVFTGMGGKYQLSPQDAIIIRKALICALNDALAQSPIETFGGYYSPDGYPMATAASGYLSIGKMRFWYHQVSGVAPFLTQHGAILRLNKDCFNTLSKSSKAELRSINQSHYQK